ncbi:MAG: Peptide/nickel transport system permease protein [Microbacteriaceae bacterium]|nr:Peptide/nickel transport system permease protein [Microbacteriaceae bacterium]
MLSFPDLRLDRGRIRRTGRRALPFSLGESIALVCLLLVVIASILGPIVSPYSPIIPSGAQLLPPGSPGHLFGTDNLGLDVLTRVMVGARTSLFAAVVTTACTSTLGLILGTIAGVVGGWLDNILMRITDVFLAFPGPIVAMAISAALGASLSSSIIGIAIVWWPLYARLARGEVRRTATSMHVEAARMSGSRGISLVLRHILPSTLPTVAISASLDIGGVIAVLASLSFIGLGTPAPAPELGLMASMGMQYLLNSWWVPVIPGLVVALLALLCNYTGDGLRGVLRARGV